MLVLWHVSDRVLCSISLNVQSIFGRRLIELHRADRMVHINDMVSPGSVQNEISVLMGTIMIEPTVAYTPVTASH